MWLRLKRDMQQRMHLAAGKQEYRIFFRASGKEYNFADVLVSV
jgi:hypothetical protein